MPAGKPWKSALASGILLFVTVSYLSWLLLFSITRYLVVLEVLTPVAVVVAASIIFQRKWTISAAIVAVPADCGPFILASFSTRTRIWTPYPLG